MWNNDNLSTSPTFNADYNNALFHLRAGTDISSGIAVLFPPAVGSSKLKPSFSKIFFPWLENRNLTNCIAPSVFLTVFGIVTSNTIGLPKFKVPCSCVQLACL